MVSRVSEYETEAEGNGYDTGREDVRVERRWGVAWVYDRMRV